MPIAKKNKQWREDCVEAYINLSNTGHAYSARKDNLKRLYDFYNGIIDEDDYRYVLKPYGKARKNFPSEMRNYPIIKPIVDLLLGEKAKRPLNFTVSVLNADAVTIKEEQKNEQLYRSLQQQFANRAAEAGIDTGMDPAEVETPASIEELFETSYVDNRAIIGQNSMNYIMADQEVKDKFDKGWFHFLICGEVYTHRTVRSSETFYEILNPVDIDYDLDPDLEFVEDGDWALIRKYVHASTVVDHYYDELSQEEILELEEPRHSETDIGFLYPNSKDRHSGTYRNRLLEVINVYWKSRKRIGFLSFIDPETGEPVEEEVQDGFKMPPELKEIKAKVEWLWVNEVWQGTRIDGRIYINVHPVANQRLSIDNPSVCKLPINGRRYSDINSENISLVSLGIPYQLNYNIYKYRLELAIAKSKDIIASFDINMIPKKWDMDKFMYFVEGTGIAWVDYNKEGIQLNPQHQSVMDMSIKTIEQYIALLESIMQEWEKLSGVNRQRQGQVGAYEGKATSQQAIVQSSHITEDLFRKFNRLEQRDLQALLDYSKEAWLNGKKTSYVMPDGTIEYLSVDPWEYSESNYGIYLLDSGEEKEKLEQIRALGQSMVQNGVPASTIAEMLDAQSFTQVKKHIKAAEKQMQELQEAQSQAQQEQAQAAMKMEEMKMENDNMNQEKDRETDIKVAEIAAASRTATDNFNLEKSLKELDIKDKEVNIKDREVNEKVRSNKSGEGQSKTETDAKRKETKQTGALKNRELAQKAEETKQKAQEAKAKISESKKSKDK